MIIIKILVFHILTYILKIEGYTKPIKYILGKPFKYLYNKEFYANFYVLLVESELTLLRVGVDKTQVGFYDITNSGFLKESYDGREAHKIFENYLPTYGDETSLNDSKYIGEKNSKGYRFFNSKAKVTAEVFWKFLPINSCIIKNLAKGLDTIDGPADGTGKTEEFGSVYNKSSSLSIYPTKDNFFVLGEIYGHALGLQDNNSKLKKNFNKIFAGKNKARYWIADVEDPKTIPKLSVYKKENNITFFKQEVQNNAWIEIAYQREIISSKYKELKYDN